MIAGHNGDLTCLQPVGDAIDDSFAAPVSYEEKFGCQMEVGAAVVAVIVVEKEIVCIVCLTFIMELIPGLFFHNFLAGVIAFFFSIASLGKFVKFPEKIMPNRLQIFRNESKLLVGGTKCEEGGFLPETRGKMRVFSGGNFTCKRI